MSIASGVCKTLAANRRYKSSDRNVGSISGFKGIGDYDSSLNMILYSCGHHRSPLLDSYTAQGEFDCSDFISLPKELKPCLTKFMININNKDLCNGLEFRDNSGLTIGAEDSKYFIYFVQRLDNDRDNSEKTMGTNSLRAYHTNINTINNELDHIIVGVHPSIFGVLIPPKTTNFLNVGHCSSKCFNQKIPEKGLTIMGVQPHVHTSGTKIKIRHFHDNNELDVILYVDHYNESTNKYYKPIHRVQFKENDTLSVECLFNNDLDNETRVTLTGKFDHNYGDMCYAYIYYYPKINVTSNICSSMNDEQTILDIADINELSGYWNSPEPIIRRPIYLNNTRLEDHLRRKIYYRDDIQQLLRLSPKRIRCDIIPQKTESSHLAYINYPDRFGK
ncbi:DBH-like monooxygenase protein 1 [Oppia nitens]|uniref:DBH-like monooxygenase protein 1 n=1 Tax=Oppia nitens TaxID=1686743 RepID=UPI0023DB7DEB|nr:DBH-like monooxygenase protein 1 [Oppia nitens]